LPTLAARASVPVHLDLNGLGRYPPSSEAALYYCCSEALQNAAKHGGPATTVMVAAHAHEQTLNLTISDTGRGFDSATRLTNMTDRCRPSAVNSSSTRGPDKVPASPPPSTPPGNWPTRP
jgi:signal transduction histidine kinase